MTEKYKTAKLTDIPTGAPPDPDSFEWKPVRHHFGIRSFGVNAGIAARAGDWVVEEHTELQGGAAGHEELYFVARGRARFSIDGEELDAPAGTFVYVPEPATLRSARAVEDGTSVIYLGAKPGEAFEISPWERKYFED
jgi:quercetin dioxygenase-like cupin family protein